MGRRRKSDNHLPPKVYQRSGSYYFVDKDGKWIKLASSYPEAMVKYAEIVGDVGNLVTVSDLLDRYLREVAPLKAEASYKSNLAQSKFLRAGLGDIRVDELTPRHIYQYMDVRGKKGKTQTNREIAMLSHMLKYAIRWGLIDHNPCRSVMRFKETPRDRYIEDKEYKAFRDFAGPLIAAYMDFKLLTGLRKSDILKLRRDALKEDGIHVLINKTKRKIIISWSDHLRAAVQAIKDLPRPINSIYLFSTRKGQPYTTDGFSSIWQRKMVKAMEKGILTERFTDHDVRAKTGSDAELEHATRLLAHLDAKVTQKHYRRKTAVVRPLM
ncbi:tyrosine-type recombinase/integrase [Shewanella loihica]|uniref:Phage integrase family protein n=1 Tax=Shewanella loihica (strain ATCC BAA-1088 / PV-4) TaxID=323850 RepID=A3QBL8_SHELP|nr:tyrosine-type recombinase/integrase [Shewanella loihica]ABO22866.1 phage integrase family protein [Shewanella loihica PV-4]